MWAALGFSVDGDRCRIGDVVVHLVGAGDGRGITGWSFDGVRVEVDVIDGLPTGVAAAPDGAAPTHPNGVGSVDHVVVMSPDGERTTAAFEAIGLEARRVRETTMGGRPVLQTFFRPPGAIIELVAPAGAGTGAPPDAGPAAFFGLALVSADLDATVAALGPHGGPPRDAVQPGRRIASIRSGELDLSVALAVMSPHR